MNIKLTAGIGSITGPPLVSTSFHEAIIAHEQCGQNMNISQYHKGMKNTMVDDTMGFITSVGQRLTEAIANYLTSEINNTFDDIKNYIQAECLSTIQAVTICSGVLHYLSVSSHKVSRIFPDFFAKENNPYYNLIFLQNLSQVCLWLDELKTNLCKNVQEDFEINRSWLIVNIKQYIENHYKEPLSLSEVANEFEISPGYISTMFKKYNDTGFAECVAEARIMHAKHLLEEGNLKIYEISEAVGYNDPYYFSKVFKKVTGFSPKDYIAQYKKRQQMS
jgi:two-component system response regulator YesN